MTESQKRYYEKNRKKINAQSRAWAKAHPELNRQRSREGAQKIRSATIEVLGSICIRCSFSDARALQIDHINGGGDMERRTTKIVGRNYYKIVIKSFLNKENKYQLLCANCNWIKRFENNENH